MMRGPEKTCYETQAGAFDQHRGKVQKFLENNYMKNILPFGLFSFFVRRDLGNGDKKDRVGGEEIIVP